MEWRDLASFNLSLNLIVVDDLLDRVHGLAVDGVVDIDHSRIPELRLPLSFQLKIKGPLPLGDLACDRLFGRVNQIIKLVTQVLWRILVLIQNSL